MDSKKLIWLGLFVGSTVGGMLPELWGDNVFSFWSVILTAVGGIIGIWLGYKISEGY